MVQIHDQHNRVRQQYASNSGAGFYKIVMGDGGFDIHYGIYRSPSATVKDATRAATLQLLGMANEALGAKPLRKMVDLGAGSGGSAHLIASQSDVIISCVDLCESHHRENRRQARKQGMEEQIETWECAFEQLPDDWASCFDLVWSQEAICHAVDKTAVFGEASRVLNKGGVLAFSDILLAESAPADEAAAFTDVNAVIQLGTESEYFEYLQAAGFENIFFEDWTPYLATNFAQMRRQIHCRYSELIRRGVRPDFLDRFANALERRLTWADGAVMRWGAFVCRKEMRPQSTDSRAKSAAS